MKNKLLVLLVTILVSCQTITVKDTSYSTSNSITELATIGQSSKKINQSLVFKTISFPHFEEKIKLHVDVVPFSKTANKAYINKFKFNQNLTQINYVDSLAVKPEMVMITIADKTTLIAELNSQENKSIKEYLKNNPKTSIVNSVLVVSSKQEIDKFKQADTFYLVQSTTAKYGVALYKNGKKTEVIDLHGYSVIGYELYNFCWSDNERGVWSIGEVVKNNSCSGKLEKKITEKKKQKNLYKM